MKASERRQLARTTTRTPCVSGISVAADKTEHFTEALNISRAGSFLRLRLRCGRMPLEATLECPQR